MPSLFREWRRWLFLALVLGLVAAGLGVRHVYVFATSPMTLEGEAVLEVPQGASYNQVAARIVERGWAGKGGVLELKLLGRILGVTSRIHAGEYRVGPDTTPVMLLDHLVGGDVILHSVTLPEGWTVAEFLDRLRATEALDTDDLPAGAESPALLRILGLAEGPHENAEGWLFPETYRFRRGDEARVILRKAHARMRDILETEWDRRDENLPIDRPYEALILASIVEKETAVPAERPMIAGVFMNRLRDGMRLQTDPTVIYGLGEAFDGNLQRHHLRESDNPYNTYRRAGLPPTPIANPGREAIRAVCQPADTEARYFVARGDGTHVFSETLDEHNRAVRRFQLGGQ
jgi:UPF0755 protein